MLQTKNRELYINIYNRINALSNRNIGYIYYSSLSKKKLDVNGRCYDVNVEHKLYRKKIEYKTLNKLNEDGEIILSGKKLKETLINDFKYLFDLMEKENEKNIITNEKMKQKVILNRNKFSIKMDKIKSVLSETNEKCEKLENLELTLNEINMEFGTGNTIYTLVSNVSYVLDSHGNNVLETNVIKLKLLYNLDTDETYTELESYFIDKIKRRHSNLDDSLLLLEKYMISVNNIYDAWCYEVSKGFV